MAPDGSVRRRWWRAAGVGVVGAVVLWLGAGAPWWAPVLVLAGALAGRLVGVLVPSRRVRGWCPLVGAVAAVGWLVAQSSGGGRAVGIALALAVVLIGVPGRWSLPRVGVAVLAGVLLAGGVAAVAVDGVQAARDRDRIDAQAGDLSRAQLLPGSPARAVRGLYVAVARGDPAACGWLAPAAEAALASSTGAADCAGAVHRLHAQVRDPDRYERPDRSSVVDRRAPDGSSGEADGCAATWTDPFRAGPGPLPGPLLGSVVGVQQLGQGYLLTEYRPCAAGG